MLEVIASAKRQRDTLKFMFTQELKGIEDFIKMDAGLVLKTQIIGGVKDAKTQLEKCKDAHLEYISVVSHSVPADENLCIEDVYTLYDNCNKRVYAYLTSVSEIEMKQKRSMNVKMERIKMPAFDGDIRNYAKFKADFKRQVEKEIDCPETLAYVLKSCLSKQPLDIVKNMEEDVVKIWKRLCLLYTSDAADE